MHRNSLKTLMSSYRLMSNADDHALNTLITFVANHPDCFERSLAYGHVTGSAWIVDLSREYVLLTYHKKLDKWLQLGGHCDGFSDVFSVALTEAKEESGLQSIIPISAEIFDIDVHLIPQYKDVTEHYHYDVRFIFQGDISEKLVISHESKDLSWIKLDEIEKFVTEPSVLRMAEKTKRLSFESRKV